MQNPMDYKKANGIVLLDKYLPDVAPFKKMAVVSTPEEWESIRGDYGDFVVQRVDFPVGSSTKCSFAGTSGYPDDLPRALEKVQAENPDGVILVLETKVPSAPRYLYNGGFNVIFSVNENVTIDLVGQGFDGRELTQGLAVHEHFEIPWDEVLFIKDRTDLLKHATYSHVRTEEYARQREARVKFLIDDCKYDKNLVQAHVPKEFKKLYSYLISELMDNIIVKLVEKAPETLRVEKLSVFGVQGNFVKGKVQPFEIFVPDHWR